MQESQMNSRKQVQRCKCMFAVQCVHTTIGKERKVVSETSNNGKQSRTVSGQVRIETMGCPRNGGQDVGWLCMHCVPVPTQICKMKWWSVYYQLHGGGESHLSTWSCIVKFHV